MLEIVLGICIIGGCLFLLVGGILLAYNEYKEKTRNKDRNDKN